MAARGGAESAATWAAKYVNQARAWTAPRIERSGLAVKDIIAPKICGALVATARRVDVTPPPRRRRWPKMVAGAALLAAVASAAAAVALRRRAKDGTRDSPGEVASAADSPREAQ